MGSFTTQAFQATQAETGTAVAAFTGERNRTKQQGGNERSDYDVVGINANKIPAMREAIRTYVAGIQAELDKMLENTAASRNKAIQNEGVHASLDNYLYAVKKYAQDLTSYMLTFSDKLADVQAAWDRFTWAQGSTIGIEQTGSFGSSGAYTEKLN